MTKKQAGLPPQWEEVFAGRSMRDIATKAGMHADRVSRFVKGGGVSDETAEKIADALGISVKKAYELRGEPMREPFHLPRKAQLLSHSQRDAILRVIDGMLEERDDKAADSTSEDQGLRLVNDTGDETRDDKSDEPEGYELAARKGETRERKRRRLEGEPWDHPDPDGPEDGA
ncbi:helix-turn-helix transcriptional regulator [Rhodococcus zopfii]|uniref:Helix-turn-helix transcriptional regulator n=1 Tax=Rhodococcus zopfii TaxID=43772 RepID=A0ABU3WTB3_9NOCA|nr:helix-turn-helix transcriptional regulator [Rhodococcus zopfii]